jgi:hypothetical protein
MSLQDDVPRRSFEKHNLPTLWISTLGAMNLDRLILEKSENRGRFGMCRCPFLEASAHMWTNQEHLTHISRSLLPIWEC